MSKVKAGRNLRSGAYALDEMDAAILANLDRNARLALSELSRLVGLSAPSVSERVQRMETAGVILGYGVGIDYAALGYAVRALVRIRPLPGKLHLVERIIQDIPQFVECDKVTGDDPFLARLLVRSIEEMDEVLEMLSDHAVTSTAVIKGRSVKPRMPPLL